MLSKFSQINNKNINEIKGEIKDALKGITAEYSSPDFSYKEKVDWFIFRSHGLLIVPPEDNLGDTAIFHFTPMKLLNINDAKEKFATTKMVITELILASQQLEKFISNHKDTHLGKVTKLEGATNRNFAIFLNRYLGLDIAELESGEYHVTGKMETLLENTRDFGTKHKKFLEAFDQH